MQMTLRWFGPDDPVRLEHIRQVPVVTGVVSSLHDEPVGAAWTPDAIAAHAEHIERAGLHFAVVESIPVHEDIKLGAPERDRWIDAYAASVRAVGEAGIPVVCYNFMPVFDWMRTDLAMPMEDGSTALAFSQDALTQVDLSQGTGDLPGWSSAYDAVELRRLMHAWSLVDAQQLWENLAYFLERIIPAAASAGVRMALHPDDPPWPIFGLPRIITDGAALRRVVSLHDDPANGITFCTGSLGVRADNALPAMVRALEGRIHFTHARNVRRVGDKSFHETAHPSVHGDVDMVAVLDALHETGFDGPMRPDHGRMIWGETGRPGYGLHDRALGAMYLSGIWEALDRARPTARGGTVSAAVRAGH